MTAFTKDSDIYKTSLKQVLRLDINTKKIPKDLQSLKLKSTFFSGWNIPIA
jgi:hypothetical protein